MVAAIRMLPTAAPCPNWNCWNDRLYDQVVSVWLALAGPPRVTTMITSNTLMVYTRPSIRTTPVTGRSSGQVMCRKRCQGPAPSRAAAS